MRLLLLSGGLDSLCAVALCGPDALLTLDYGQRHAGPEITAAHRIAEHYGKPIFRRACGDLFRDADSSLLNDRGALQGPATVVPGRNLLFASIGASIVEAHGGGEVLIASVRDDHAVYADCRPVFNAATHVAISESSERRVAFVAPFQACSKAGIVRNAHALDAPFALSYSCYRGGAVHCGTCGACRLRQQAFRETGIPDPTVYTGVCPCCVG